MIKVSETKLSVLLDQIDVTQSFQVKNFKRPERPHFITHNNSSTAAKSSFAFQEKESRFLQVQCTAVMHNLVIYVHASCSLTHLHDVCFLEKKADFQRKLAKLFPILYELCTQLGFPIFEFGVPYKKSFIESLFYQFI